MRIEEEIKQKEFQNPHEKVTVNIIYTSNWLTAVHQRRMKKHGISMQQYNILRILRGQKGKPISVNSLIDRMLDKMSNASRLVEKLRQKGYVDRQVSAHDRRQVDVRITKKGLDFLEAIEPELNEIHKNLNTLTPEDAEQLSALLDKLRG